MLHKDQGKFITFNVPDAKLDTGYYRVEVTGGPVRTHYYDLGNPDRETVIFVQTGGFGTSAYMCWRLNLEAFADAGYHVLAPDSVGFGLTERAGDPTLPSQFFGIATNFLTAFMNAMSLKQAHFIGNSMGSNALTRFAFERPDRVRSLVLTGGEPRVETEQSRALAQNLGKTPTMDSERAILNKPELDVEDMKEIAGHFFYDDAHPQIAAVAEMLLETMRRPGVHERAREDAMKMLQRGRFHYRTADFAAIQAPTYLIHGRDERFFYPPEIADTLTEYAMKVALVIPDCSLTLLPHCGHWPQIEMPGRFNALALEFLSSLKARG